MIDGLDLCRKWFTGADKRDPGKALQKFIEYNKRQFEYLEITPSVVGKDERAGITFRTSRYIGAIPLRAPDTGKQIGDMVVAPRFVNRERFEDYIEILDLLGQAISPEIVHSLPLASGRNFRPPFYLDAVRFVVALEQLLRKPWRKFECVEVVRSEPAGQVDWRNYVERENRAENKFRFPVRQNVLSEFHREFRQIRFVFDICNKELRSTNVPNRIRNTFRSRLAFIEQRLYLHKPLATDAFGFKSSDRPAVKNCKEQANRILKREHSNSTAWRVDLNDVFEKFVLHIFERIAHALGGRLAVNPLIQTTRSNYYSGEMRQLEAAAVLLTQELTAFIDAKYRSHLLNRSENNDVFENDLRRLHDHTSFAAAGQGIGVICYPSDRVEVKATRDRNPFSKTPNNLLIVGIPLKRSVISDAVGQIAGEIDRLRTEFRSVR